MRYRSAPSILRSGCGSRGRNLPNSRRKLRHLFVSTATPNSPAASTPQSVACVGPNCGAESIMAGGVTSVEQVIAICAGMLDRAASEPDGSLAFRILRIDMNPPRHDGTPPRNKCMVQIEIDAAVHTVPVRSEQGNVHIPASLKHHPLRERIKTAVSSAALLAERGRLPVGEAIERGAWVRYLAPGDKDSG